MKIDSKVIRQTSHYIKIDNKKPSLLFIRKEFVNEDK